MDITSVDGALLAPVYLRFVLGQLAEIVVEAGSLDANHFSGVLSIYASYTAKKLEMSVFEQYHYCFCHRYNM